MTVNDPEAHTDPVAQGVLGWEAVDQFLADLAAKAREFAAEAAAGAEAAERWNDRGESALEQSQGAPAARLDPEAVVTCLRHEIAEATWREFRQTLRELLAWRADVCAYAVLAAAGERPIALGRVMAAAPCGWWAANGATHLPPVPDGIRDLLELSARLGPSGGAGRRMIFMPK